MKFIPQNPPKIQAEIECIFYCMHSTYITLAIAIAVMDFMTLVYKAIITVAWG